MKTLLRRMLCTQDDAVFDVLTHKGWPNHIYTITESLWDINTLHSRQLNHLISIKQDIPIKLFQQYSVEIAKEIVKSEYGGFYTMSFFARNCLVRSLTKEDIDEILKGLHFSQKKNVRDRIAVLNNEFKLGKAKIPIQKVSEH